MEKRKCEFCGAEYNPTLPMCPKRACIDKKVPIERTKKVPPELRVQRGLKNG